MTSLLLFGFKSVGKSTLGKRLSEALALPFVDTDDLILSVYGKEISTRELYHKIGEKAFRELEKKALLLIARKRTQVIALGGGTLCHEGNLPLLQSMGRLVYLQIEKETLRKKLLSPPYPAYFDVNDPEGYFERFYAERKALFERAAAFSVCLENKRTEAILEELTRIYYGQQ